MKEISFKIIDPESLSQIKEVRTGSNPDVIVLIVQNEEQNIEIFTWSLIDNSEQEAYEIGKEEFEILWDLTGNPYIVTGSSVTFTKQRTTLKNVFPTPDFDIINKSNSNAELSSHKGHRFDGNNHNWLIFNEYISLGFSYMTFVILDKIEKKDELQEGNQFDNEPYNYVFYKSTSFLAGKFVYDDHLRLEYVLQNIGNLDEEMLEILTYVQNIFTGGDRSKEIGINSALHMAVQEGNTRSVNILLQFMAKVEFNSSRSFSSIFDQLVEYQGFLTYLERLPLQTSQMLQKNVLKIKEADSDLIVRMCSTQCIYVDDQFY